MGGGYEERPAQESPSQGGPDLVPPCPVYEGEYFLCEVTQNQEDVAKGNTRLSYTTIKAKTALPGERSLTVMITLNEDIPQPINSRGHFGLDNSDLIAVLKKMAMVYFSSLLNLFVLIVYNLYFF
jgi:hypothetical protein